MVKNWHGLLVAGGVCIILGLVGLILGPIYGHMYSTSYVIFSFLFIMGSIAIYFDVRKKPREKGVS